MEAIDEERFTQLVEDALDGVPEALMDRLVNVAVIVEDVNPTEPDLLGLYEGIPQTERWDYGGVLPDKISVYRLPLCDMAVDEEELVREIRVTVVHEIAHHLGISDAELHGLGWG